MMILYWILAFLQAASPGASISGAVINAGGVLQRPLQNARLELSGPGGIRVTRTDGEGLFAFVNLAAGRYRVKVARDGFIRQTSPTIVVKAGQTVNDITFNLQPAPTIYGAVLDGVEGEPKLNALVQALRMGYGARGGRVLTVIASTVTDDKGRYRLYWLDPGEYKIGVHDPGPKESRDLNLVPTYYSGITDPDEAQRVRLKTGREMDLGDFRLSTPLRTLNVTGSVISAVTGKPLAVPSTVTLTLAGTVDNKFQFQGQTIYTPCTALYEGPCPPSPTIEGFWISGVPNGLYVAVAHATSGERGVALVDARKYLEGAERLVKNVRIVVGPPVNVNGRARSEGNAPLDLRNVEVTLTSIEPVIPSPAAVRLNADGTFTIGNMQTGSYLVSVSGLPEDAYMKAAHVGKTDVLENSLEVRYGSLEPIEIVLSPDGGEVSGTVVDRAGQRVAGADVVLVPDPRLRYRVDQYRTDATDRNGGFDIRGIQPGDYKLFAWENLEANAYLSADFIREYEPQGVPVRIEPARNGSVQVRVIPGEL